MSNKSNVTVVSSGLSFGASLAATISFVTHQSVLWAIIHGFFSWLYILYYLITR